MRTTRILKSPDGEKSAPFFSPIIVARRTVVGLRSLGKTRLL